MPEKNSGLARRDFLGRVGALAGAPLAAELLSGVAPASAAETTPGLRPAKGLSGYTTKLAQYAAAFKYEDAPDAIRARMKDCITDTVATILHGGQMPWSKMMIAFARANGAGGKSHILGTGGGAVHAASAALAHGAMAHAFELDNITYPDTGVHMGASMFSSGLAVCQERGLSGRELLTAMVACGEVVVRIGRAAKGTIESRGFHAPGTTTPFGAAATVGKLLNLDATKLANALAIAGSMSAGLLEFAHSGTGAMVKRLHLGHGAHAGVLAASLAADGFTGPGTALEGEAGYLHAFADGPDVALLTKGLGQEWAVNGLMIKRYPCHVTAQPSVDAMMELQRDNKFSGDDIASIAIAGNTPMVAVHNDTAPADAMMAQYSIPFCAALSCYRNPVDPDSFDEKVAGDPRILALAKRVSMKLTAGQGNTDFTTVLDVVLKDGRKFNRRVTDFKGTPARPLNQAELKEKFMVLSKRFPRPAMEALFARLQNIGTEKTLDWLSV